MNQCPYCSTRLTEDTKPGHLKGCQQISHSFTTLDDTSLSITYAGPDKYWVDAKVSADFLKNVFKRCSATMDAWFSCI